MILVLTKTEWEQGLGQSLHRLSEESIKTDTDSSVRDGLQGSYKLSLKSWQKIRMIFSFIFFPFEITQFFFSYHTATVTCLKGCRKVFFKIPTQKSEIHLMSILEYCINLQSMKLLCQMNPKHSWNLYVHWKWKTCFSMWKISIKRKKTFLLLLHLVVPLLIAKFMVLCSLFSFGFFVFFIYFIIFHGLKGGREKVSKTKYWIMENLCWKEDLWTSVASENAASWKKDLV